MPNKYYFLSNYCKLFRLTSAYNFSAEYDVHVEQKTHAEAIRACKRLGRKLFEPRDFSANSEVLALAKSKGVTRFWIGIHDITNEGNFTYDSNGQTISYMNWFLNEPNNIGSGEDCAEAMVGNWNDLSCKGKRPFVCEKTQKTSSRLVETCKILIISTIVPIQISDTNIDTCDRHLATRNVSKSWCMSPIALIYIVYSYTIGHLANAADIDFE